MIAERLEASNLLGGALALGQLDSLGFAVAGLVELAVKGPVPFLVSLELGQLFGRVVQLLPLLVAREEVLISCQFLRRAFAGFESRQFDLASAAHEVSDKLAVFPLDGLELFGVQVTAFL